MHIGQAVVSEPFACATIRKGLDELQIDSSSYLFLSNESDRSLETWLKPGFMRQYSSQLGSGEDTMAPRREARGVTKLTSSPFRQTTAIHRSTSEASPCLWSTKSDRPEGPVGRHLFL